MLDGTEIEVICQVLKSGMLVGGATRRRFADRLSAVVDKTDVGPCLFSSGRMAVRAALEALHLPAGAGIIVQSYVCDAVIWAITSAGHIPVLCDIGEGWVSELKQVEAVMNKRCGALILAPPFGFAQSAFEFRNLGLPIIHDLCQVVATSASKHV